MDTQTIELLSTSINFLLKSGSNGVIATAIFIVTNDFCRCDCGNISYAKWIAVASVPREQPLTEK